jgi:hypothetical protein
MLLCEQNVCNLGTTARMDDVLDASGLLGRAFHIFFREQHGAPPGKIWPHLVGQIVRNTVVNLGYQCCFARAQCSGSSLVASGRLGHRGGRGGGMSIIGWVGLVREWKEGGIGKWSELIHALNAYFLSFECTGYVGWTWTASRLDTGIKVMLYCPIFRVGTAEIIYHDGDANYVHEIIDFMAECGCWRVELSCIAERVKWVIWCLVRKGVSGV